MRKNILAVLLALFFISTASAQVIITEVLYDPSGNDGFGGGACTDPAFPGVNVWGNTEYIELFNASGIKVDMTGWVAVDNGQTLGTFKLGNGDLMLNPGEFAVLITDKDNGVIDDANGNAPSVANFIAAWNVPAPPAAEVVVLDGMNQFNNVQLTNGATDTPITIMTSGGITVDSADYNDTALQGESLNICTLPLRPITEGQ